MKQISIAILLCLCTLAGFAQGGQPLDLKDIVSGKFRAENIYGVIPIPGDGEHYSQMNADKTQIIKYSFKTGKPVEVLFDAATALPRGADGDERRRIAFRAADVESRSVCRGIDFGREIGRSVARGASAGGAEKRQQERYEGLESFHRGQN